MKKLLPVGESADLLRYNPTSRAIAAIFWEQVQNNEYPALWPERARTAMNIHQLFHNDDALLDLQAEIEADISLFYKSTRYLVKVTNKLKPQSILALRWRERLLN